MQYTYLDTVLLINQTIDFYLLERPSIHYEDL